MFEQENNVADFEQEPVYDPDCFDSKNFKLSSPISTPPPNFQQELQKLPEDLRKHFEQTLNASIVGIWPIKKENFLGQASNLT